MREAPRRDLYAGSLLVVIGVGVVIEGAAYDIGSPSTMGSGFFPVVLGVVLATVGSLIAMGALLRSGPSSNDNDAKINMPEWRGIAAIAAGGVAFIVMGTLFGLAPAAFSSVFISALGDRTSTIRSSAMLALLMTVFAVGVFSYLLRLQMPIFQLPIGGSSG